MLASIVLLCRDIAYIMYEIIEILNMDTKGEMRTSICCIKYISYLISFEDLYNILIIEVWFYTVVFAIVSHES